MKWTSELYFTWSEAPCISPAQALIQAFPDQPERKSPIVCSHTVLTLLFLLLVVGRYKGRVDWAGRGREYNVFVVLSKCWLCHTGSLVGSFDTFPLRTPTMGLSLVADLLNPLPPLPPFAQLLCFEETLLARLIFSPYGSYWILHCLLESFIVGCCCPISSKYFQYCPYLQPAFFWGWQFPACGPCGCSPLMMTQGQLRPMRST